MQKKDYRLQPPRNKGGLELCKIEAVNEAFQRKLPWKVLTNNSSLWV